MIVLTPQQMQELDRRTIDAGTPALVLMERAARGLVEFLISRFRLSQERLVAVCGKGNNGADARLAAQLLAGQGIAVAEWPTTIVPSLILDGVLGVGLRGPAQGLALDQIRWINEHRTLHGARVVAVDVPSGLGTGEHVTADYTVTFGALKTVHVLPPECEACGEIHVVDIGLLPAESSLHQIDPPRIPPRPPNSHKGDYGHVLVIGGAPGKQGAAVMAGFAALRAGAGLVTVTGTASYPELMTAEFPPAWPRAGPPPWMGKTVIAIGPGLGGNSIELVRRLYAECPVPVVVDADGLNSLAGWELPIPPALRVLTPHPGEFRRLAPELAIDSGASRVTAACQFALQHGVTMVLKGYRTVVAGPDGIAYVNPTGSPAMAKAGSGDILTGLIAGLLAQPHVPAPVTAAVWLHGRCGELGERDKAFTLLATELLDYLPDALRSAHA